MAKLNALTHAMNLGEVSRAGLNRVDKEALRLYAERQENIFPYTIGKGLFRPGSKLIGETPSNNRPRYLPFIKAVGDTALLELTASKLRVWLDDALITRPAVTATVSDGDFSSSAGWTLSTTGDAVANINSTAPGGLYLAAPNRGGKARCSQSVTVNEDGVEHALRVLVTRGPVTLRVGSTDGGDDYIPETSLGTGEHSLAFTPTGASGGNDSFTKLLLHCDGADASTTFTDSSAVPHTVTANSNAQLDTAQAKFGTASGLFDGTNDSIQLDGSADFAFGTGDFTIDMWVRPNTTGIDQTLYDGRPAGTFTGNYPVLRLISSNVLFFARGATNLITGTTTLTTGTWYHVAVTRSGTTIRLFLNGLLQGSVEDGTAYINGASRPILGADGNVPTALELNGWLDEIRVSKGIARWTGNFAPPTVAFTSGSVFFIEFSSKRNAGVIVDSVQIEAAGVMEIAAPWSEDQLRGIRVDQSLDVVFMAHGSWQQRKIERRAPHSWSLVLYQSDDGPFTTARTAAVKLKPAATHGNTTLTADGNFFKPSHVGALFQLAHDRFAASFGLGAEDTYSDPYRVQGIGPENDHTVVVTGTFVGTLTIQRSYDDPNSGFVDTSVTATAPGTMSSTLGVEFDNQIVWTRVGFKAGAYTSGSATVAPTYGGHHGLGVCRVTSYVSPTVVNVEVLSDFKNTFYTADWLEGEWSDALGWPTAVAFYDGRLWWARKDQFWGSESNNYTAFNLETEGDSGSVQRNIAVGGAANAVKWIMGLQRLIMGADSLEASARSSSFDAPITPSDLTLKAASNVGAADISPINVGSRGAYISRDGLKLYELAFNVDLQDYASVDLMRLHDEIGDSMNPDLYEDGFVELALQTKPMPYLFAVRADGALCSLLYNPTEEARGLFKLLTGAVTPLVSTRPTDRVISIAVLPSFGEDRVYLGVERTISDGAGGTTQVHYLEKLGLHTETITRIYNSTTRKVEVKNGLTMADSYITTSGTSAIGQVITGLTHLAGRDVIIIGQAVGGLYGPSEDNYTVSDAGQITTLQAFSGTLCVGLPYAGFYQSAKLAYAAQGGTALTMPKRVQTLGLALLDTHPDALRLGSEFLDDITLMDELPRTDSRGAVVDPTANFARASEERPFPFPGIWDTDSRVCIMCRPGYSACLSGIVTGIETAG